MLITIHWWLVNQTGVVVRLKQQDDGVIMSFPLISLSVLKVYFCFCIGIFSAQHNCLLHPHFAHQCVSEL